MKVAFDATCLAGAARYRGVGTYARQILTGLGAMTDFDVAALAPAAAELPPGVDRVGIRRWREHRWSVREHEALLPFDLDRTHAAVAFEPSPDPPRRCRMPLVQALHDVIPLVRDDPDLADERRRWRHYAPRYRGAAAVITNSRHTADEGIRVLGLDPRRVHVSHLGADPLFRPGPAPDGDPYVVMVSEYSRRKGFDAAFAAIGAVADAGLPHVLRVGGRIAPWVRPELERLVAAAHTDRIELLDFVADLPGLYRGAAVAIVTSRYEGFGLPALEAMACGTPVVAWSNTATAEVVAGGGVLVADGDLDALVVELIRVLREPGWAAELRERALERARAFSWERAVGIHADVLRAVAG